MLEVEIKQTELGVDFGKAVLQKHNSLFFFLLKHKKWAENKYVACLRFTGHFTAIFFLFLCADS